MEEIISKSNPRIIAAQKLHQRKYREATGLFCFEGIKLTREAIHAGLDLTEIFVTRAALSRLNDFPTDRLTLVCDTVYNKLTLENAPEGIFCVAKQPQIIAPKNDTRILIASVRDPGNIGAILRSALAFGIGQVIFSSDCADLYSPKTARSAMGALFRQSVLVTKNISAEIDNLRKCGYNLCAAVLSERAVLLSDLQLDTKTCFVIGNEGHGLDETIIRACNTEVIIPIDPTSESLNASVAASILLWEMKRSMLNG